MVRTQGRSRLTPLLIAALALGATLGAVAAPAAAVVDTVERAAPSYTTQLSRWTGGVNVYRKGVFTTQKTWWYCTAADIQIIRNIVEHDNDHSTSGQTRYFDWMRTRNRYDIPVRAGIDPAGWTAGMRHFIDGRYRLVASASFDGALRLAVKRLRLTNLPVALAVDHGNHGWILHGFTATADPAITKNYRITSVRVTGPLWGRQSEGGYDMPPNTKLTPAQLERYFTRWRYAPLPMIWDGKYVSIQPVPKKTATAAASPSPSPSPLPTPSPSPSPTPSLSQSPAAGAVIPSAAPSIEAAPPVGEPTGAWDPLGASPVLAGVAGLLAAVILAALLARRRRQGSSA